MRRLASEVLRNLESRIARLENVQQVQRTALQIQRNRSIELQTKVKKMIARELGGSLRNCVMTVLNEGFDSELDTTYYFVSAKDKSTGSALYTVVADQYGEQGIEDFGTMDDMLRMFKLLTR